MTLTRAAAFNYFSHAYVALVGLLALGIYIKFIDPETYGLVAFYGVTQAWFILLDLGLGATISRETARQQAGAQSIQQLRQLLRGSEYFFAAMSVLGAAVLVAGAHFISTHWLNIQTLALDQATLAIKFMAVSMALRLITVAYRSMLTGMEDFLRLSLLNTFFATLRFVAVIPFFVYVSTEAVDFFIYQMVISAGELAAFRRSARKPFFKDKRLGSAVNQPLSTPNDLQIQGWIRFSLAAGTTAGLWIAVTQVDRLILSNRLSLGDFGYFNLAVVVASAVFVATVPINTVLTPRMARLHAGRNDERLFDLYRTGTQIIAVATLPIVGLCHVLSAPILWVLTGNAQLVQVAAPVLSLYVIGNALLVFSLCPYLLQYARGNMKMHLTGNTLLLIGLGVGMAWATSLAGMSGAGWAWITVNALYFALWVPLIHHRWWPGMHLKWLAHDIGPIAGAVSLISLVWQALAPHPTSRLQAAIVVVALGASLLMAAMFASQVMRRWLSAQYARRRSSP